MFSYNILINSSKAEWCIYAPVNLAIIVSDNSLSPFWHQAIIIDWILGNKCQWNWNKNTAIFIKVDEFKMSTTWNVGHFVLTLEDNGWRENIVDTRASNFTGVHAFYGCPLQSSQEKISFKLYIVFLCVQQTICLVSLVDLSSGPIMRKCLSWELIIMIPNLNSLYISKGLIEENPLSNC